jgi:hypothetical protein
MRVDVSTLNNLPLTSVFPQEDGVRDPDVRVLIENICVRK